MIMIDGLALQDTPITTPHPQQWNSVSESGAGRYRGSGTTKCSPSHQSAGEGPQPHSRLDTRFVMLAFLPSQPLTWLALTPTVVEVRIMNMLSTCFC